MLRHTLLLPLREHGVEKCVERGGGSVGEKGWSGEQECNRYGSAASQPLAGQTGTGGGGEFAG